jgi:hypothetical protein
MSATLSSLWKRLKDHAEKRGKKCNRFSWLGVFEAGKKGLKKKHVKSDLEKLVMDVKAFAIYLAGGKLEKQPSLQAHEAT